MRGWAELALCAGVLVACWVRTPVGQVGEAAWQWARGEPVTVDPLARFRTELPDRLDAALDAALAVGPAAAEGPWSAAVDLAVRAHLGEEAHAAVTALGIDQPAEALETWAVGRAARDRAVARARAAGAAHPERLDAHAAYLSEADAAAARAAVSDTLALATVLDLAWPVDPSVRVSSGFGYRHHPTLGRQKLHEGVDLAVPIGTPVHAAGAGRITRAREDEVNGQYVIVDHGHRVRTAYCHGSALHVSKGDAVARGALLLDSGNSGRSTGPHLHFGLRIAGRPVDPEPFRARAAVASDGPGGSTGQTAPSG